MSSLESSEPSRAEGMPELTPEQWEEGKEIADYCGIAEEELEQMMLWNGVPATVGYGLAHSARYMEHLTVDEIRAAISKGVTDYQTTLGSPNEAH